MMRSAWFLIISVLPVSFELTTTCPSSKRSTSELRELGKVGFVFTLSKSFSFHFSKISFVLFFQS